MVADVGCVVTGTAGSQERRKAPRDQASGCYIIVDACYAANGNLQSVEELLTASDGASGGCVLIVFLVVIVFIVPDSRPLVVELEDVGTKLAIAWVHKPTGLLESWDQEMDAGVDRDEERLGGERDRTALRTPSIQGASVAVPYLCGKEFRLEVYNLLLFRGGWARPVPLSVNYGSVYRLMR